VDLTSAQVGGNVSAGEIKDLPSITRNFPGLVALLPGVHYNPASDGASDSVTINGQHGSGVVFLMDGGSNNDDLRGGSAGAQARTPLEAVQEFQVVTNQFDAEYGAATAGVINAVSKQGSNALHGSAIGYSTDGSLTANFSNPSGDQRLGTFLIPTSLSGGWFPRQFQIGARFWF
jgi:outer membrane receptor for ferrienterochelin and colicin